MNWGILCILLVASAFAFLYSTPPGALETFRERVPAGDRCNWCDVFISCYGENRTRCVKSDVRVCTTAFCVEYPPEDSYFDYYKIKIY